jgi:hypothetical protein
MRRLTLLSVLLASIALPAVASAQDGPTLGPHTETGSSGSVAATLTYTMPTEYEATDVRIAITRDGQPAPADADVAAGCKECHGAMPIGVLGLEGSDTKSLTFADLSGDGDPEVIVDLYTGGAHCCWISAIYGWDAATQSYRRLVHFWGDPAYRLAELGGGPGQELVTYDDRFAYAFCAYVCSLMPQIVYRYTDGRLVDVTMQYPARIRSEIRELRKLLRQVRRDKQDPYTLRGVLPALCADLYRLNRGAECRRALNTAMRRGQLRRAKDDFVPGGRKYVRDVLVFLKKTGYR